MYMRERERERCCEDTQAVHVGEDQVDRSAPAGCVDTAWLVRLRLPCHCLRVCACVCA